MLMSPEKGRRSRTRHTTSPTLVGARSSLFLPYRELGLIVIDEEHDLAYKQDPKGFLDAIAFWDEKHGMALGDPVKGLFQLLVTTDGGANWKPLAAKTLPPALAGEGAFAASGTCLVTHGDSDVWFTTGGAKAARVFPTPPIP